MTIEYYIKELELRVKYIWNTSKLKRFYQNKKGDLFSKHCFLNNRIVYELACKY